MNGCIHQRELSFHYVIFNIDSERNSDIVFSVVFCQEQSQTKAKRSFIFLNVLDSSRSKEKEPLSKNLLNTNIAGLKLSSPTALASGVLGYSGDSMQRIAEAGAGAIVTKSVGVEAQPGYPNP